jgi:CubicO group peptidase (beta-lactamase class C family)
VPEHLAAELDRLVRIEQRDGRLPSITAAVLRDGDVVWELAVGVADAASGREATADTQYRVGSITKTFTAAAILQLRDEGRLDLDDTLERHLPGAAHTPSLRRLLSHASGLQRETHDEGWLQERFAPVEELLETFDRAEQVMPGGARFHYSNLAFALLGAVVERVAGRAYETYVREKLLVPLGLGRLSFEPEPPAVNGYLVEPWSETVREEPPLGGGAWSAAGQLWGTVGDLCRWAWCLAEPDEGVLARATVEELRTVQTISDPVRWTAGYGLGVTLLREGERILAGHSGAMPGFIAAMYVSPDDRVAAAALTNNGVASLDELVTALVAAAVERWPVPAQPWRAQERPPDDVAPLLGHWFTEGHKLALRWRDGALEAKLDDAPAWKRPALLQREAPDRWRVASGWEQGELLRVERDANGAVARLVLAGYPVTREPRTWR